METKTKTDIKTNTFAADDVKCLELRIAAADVGIKRSSGRGNPNRGRERGGGAV